ncbi:hypothetical protein B0H13DRAFT_2125218 [Mycena leptocephala]|nr:hypothetical protein B0H13DRAFT_2125218 [Mycena leptocephala]
MTSFRPTIHLVAVIAVSSWFPPPQSPVYHSSSYFLSSSSTRTSIPRFPDLCIFRVSLQLPSLVQSARKKSTHAIFRPSPRRDLRKPNLSSVSLYISY